MTSHEWDLITQRNGVYIIWTRCIQCGLIRRANKDDCPSSILTYWEDPEDDDWDLVEWSVWGDVWGDVSVDPNGFRSIHYEECDVHFIRRLLSL